MVEPQQYYLFAHIYGGSSKFLYLQTAILREYKTFAGSHVGTLMPWQLKHIKTLTWTFRSTPIYFFICIYITLYKEWTRKKVKNIKESLEKTASGHSGHSGLPGPKSTPPCAAASLPPSGGTCGEHASSECPWKPMTRQVKHSRCEMHGDTLGIPAILAILAKKIRLDEHG